MKKFKFLLTAMLLSCSSMSFAQFMNGGSSSSSSSDVPAWKGLRVSYDRTFVSYDGDIDDIDLDMNGFSVGYVQSFNIAKSLPIFLETGAGINYAVQKYDFNEYYEKDEYTTSTLGLTIPLNIVYGIKVNESLTLKPYTGFYLRVNLMSKTTNDYINTENKEESKDWNNFDKDEADPTWNRVQVGWQIGTTLDINKFNVGISYALDFNEYTKKEKASKFSVNLGYNF